MKMRKGEALPQLFRHEPASRASIFGSMLILSTSTADAFLLLTQNPNAAFATYGNVRITNLESQETPGEDPPARA